MQLEELKKAYEASKCAKESYARLLKEREALFIAQKRGQLRLIDHRLDILEEGGGDELREALIGEICERVPESKPLYEALCQKLDVCQKNAKSTLDLIEQLDPLQRVFQEGVATKPTEGRWSIFFSGHRKAALSRAIRKCMNEANRIYPFLNDKTTKGYLDKFLDEAGRPWNNALYQTRFYELGHEFGALFENIVLFGSQLTADVLQIEKEIDEWIEQFLLS